MQGKVVLLIEDEDELRTLLAHHLERQGLIVLQARNGVEGLALALQRMPDLVLLDLRMPEMTGFEMLKRLRTANDWGEHVPVIMLTNMTPASAEEEKDINALEPAHYIVKSEADPDDVVAKIRQLLH